MITVLGASGFVGRHLVEELRRRSLEHLAPARDESLAGRSLGDVVYCIGLTADFRSRPLDTVEAHVCRLLDVLRHLEFDSLTYLSSTRLYGTRPGCARETDPIVVTPSDPDDLYDISKAMGESLAMHCGRPARVARLSNVHGDDFASGNFLPAIVRDAVTRGKVLLQTSERSAKDYVSVRDVVDGLLSLATRGRHDLYNVASGVNVSNGDLAESLRRLTGCEVEFAPGAPDVVYPGIDISRMRDELGFAPAGLLEGMDELVAACRRRLGAGG